MGIKTKVTLAAGFVGAVAIAAAAFGQTGGSGGQAPSAAAANASAASPAQHGGGNRQNGCAPVRPRALRRVVHGDMKVERRNGVFADVTIDTGQITAVDHSAKSITLKRDDGQSVTATATDKTRVCIDGHASSFDALKVGDRARLMQVQSDRFTGLRRIAAITPDAAANANGSPAGFGNNDLFGPDNAA